MPKRKRKIKIKEPKFARGIQIPETLLRARYLRSNLLARVKTKPEKDLTPHVNKLHQIFLHNHFICYYCLNELSLSDVTIDHRTPLAKGGTNQFENLCIACNDCNTLKGEFSELEFRAIQELAKSFDDNGEYLWTRLRRAKMIFAKK